MPHAFRPYGASSGDRYHDDALLDAAVRGNTWDENERRDTMTDSQKSPELTFLEGQAAALNATYKALARPRVPDPAGEDMPELRRQRDALLAAAERVLAEIDSGEVGEYLARELGPAVRAARGETVEAGT